MTAEVPAASEQRAEVRLTDGEREALHAAFEEFRRGRFTTAGTLYVAVERILADRAAAEDHGLRALGEVERRIKLRTTLFNKPEMDAVLRVLHEVRAALGDTDSHRTSGE